GQQITVSLQAVLAVLGLLLASAFACVVFMLWRRRSAATSSR
ncbi:MAG: hypothetical protein QOJ75_1109, partial [Chloroflexota bacterium]|nr:hypothetical protein [Chloroflexota bacterium]